MSAALSFSGQYRSTNDVACHTLTAGLVEPIVTLLQAHTLTACDDLARLLSHMK